MMILRIFYIFFIFHTTTQAVEFEKISLQNFQKEVLSFSHLRLYQNTGSLTIHLQAEKYDSENQWHQDTLVYDIEVMFKKRKAIYELLGFTQAKLDFFNYENKTLTLRGSYIKLNGEKVYFEERNFYHREHFLQLKVLSSSRINALLIDRWTEEISPFSVELDQKLNREDND